MRGVDPLDGALLTGPAVEGLRAGPGVTLSGPSNGGGEFTGTVTVSAEGSAGLELDDDLTRVNDVDLIPGSGGMFHFRLPAGEDSALYNLMSVPAGWSGPDPAVTFTLTLRAVAAGGFPPLRLLADPASPARGRTRPRTGR